MAVRRCKKVDLRRIAKATGGKHNFFYYCMAWNTSMIMFWKTFTEQPTYTCHPKKLLSESFCSRLLCLLQLLWDSVL